LTEESPACPLFPPYLSPEDIARHPRFDDAVSNLIDGLANLYGDDRRLVRELSEYGRAVTFMLAICIAMAAEEDRPDTWLTVGRLAQLGALLGLGTERRIRRFVEEMRSDGYLIETPMPGDKRRHRLHPGPRMLEIDREWTVVFHAPLALMMPQEARYQAAISGDPNYHRLYRAASLKTLGLARDNMVEHLAVDSFMHQAGGSRVLAALMRAAQDNPGGWSEAGFYSMAAERSATTRAHVRGMIRAAAAAGYVEIADAPNSRVRATRLLVDDFRSWVAQGLSAIDLVSRFAENASVPMPEPS